MGAQWKKANKMANSSEKGKLVTKLAREIQVAARTGDPSPDHNPKLRAAVYAARKARVPKDTIERAIKKGAGLLDDGQSFETVVYEGFGPHKIPVIVECLTDNKNRTAAEIKQLFKKGALGGPGSVGWMFDRMGVIEASHPDKSTDLEAVAIEAGAQSVEAIEVEDNTEDHIGARFVCDVTDLDSVNKFLQGNGWHISVYELQQIAKDFPTLNEAQQKEVSEFLNELDEFDDTHRVFAALK